MSLVNDGFGCACEGGSRRCLVCTKDLEEELAKLDEPIKTAWTPKMGDRVRVVKNRFRLLRGQRIDLEGETGTVVAVDVVGGNQTPWSQGGVAIRLDRPRVLWDESTWETWWCSVDEIELATREDT